MSDAAEQHASLSLHPPAHPSVFGLVANFAALMLLLAATVAISKVELEGPGNFIAAALIAVMKMTLIMLFFMNLRYSKPLSRLAICAGFFWLAILFALSFSDYVSRGWLTPGQQEDPRSETADA